MRGRQPPIHYAQSTGAKIAFQVSGQGGHDLLVSPGLVSHLDLQWHQAGYRRFMSALERRCRLIRFDKRGTGLSDPTDGLPDQDVRVADMAAVMKAAGSQSAVVLGISDGGRAAIAFAVAHPKKAKGLILYGTSYRGPRQTLLRQYRAAVRRWGEGRLLDIVAPTVVTPELRQEFADFERAAASPAMAAALIESMAVADVRALLSALTLPTLVLHREHDTIPLRDARVVARLIPGATLTALEGRDHLPWVGDWEAVAGAILEFINQAIPSPAEHRVLRSRPDRRNQSRAAARPVSGWASLTAAERRVVALAAQGHGNAEIADRLFLSRHTVETHLRRVFPKLGVRSRAELAAVSASTRGREILDFGDAPR